VGARRNWRVLDGYAGWLGMSVSAGILAMSVQTVVGSHTSRRLGLALLVGCLAGAIARWSDRAIVRAVARHRVVAAPAWGATSGVTGRSRGTTPEPGALLLGGPSARAPRGQRLQTQVQARDPRQFPLATVLAIAVLEEGFFRGVLLQTALIPNAVWADVGFVSMTLLAFSAAHVYFGWQHVIAKTPLGMVTVTSVIALGTLVPAVVAHVWFNFSVWREMTAGGRIR
jgi:hypothetical protein